MDLKETAILGEHINEHWYYRAKAEAMLRCLKPIEARRILDVGAGSGFFSKYLLTHTGATAAVCVDPYYSRDRSDIIAAGKSIEYRRACDFVDADLVLMMDVLEHVEDDVALIREYTAKVREHTRFLITVPAFSFLWSGHDVFLGHKRRYTLSRLQQSAVNAGLRIEKAHYFFGIVFPLAVVVRLGKKWLGHGHLPPASDLKQHYFLTNQLLYRLCRLELGLQNYNRFAGLSVFCVARC